jgi:hypothetical protein
MVDYTSDDWVPHKGFETLDQAEGLRVSRTALLRGSHLEEADGGTMPAPLCSLR